jgi:hypothetical protein
MDLRTPALAIGAFCAAFVVGWWLNIGGLAAGFGASAAKTAADVPATVGVAAPPSSAPQGRGLTEDQRIRDDVIAWAKTYQRPACGQDVRWNYVSAATKYAEALMRAAGCSNFPRCPMSEGQLNRVWQANRSPDDQRVAEAMAAAHSAGGLSDRNFRGDVGRAARVIAGREFASGSSPDCVASNSGNRRFRVRFRR